MKKLKSLIFFIFISGLIFGQSIEISYLNQNESSNFRDIYFVDGLVGYASSYSGKIIKTSDGGETWTTIYSNSDINVLGLYFINEDYGFAVGGNSGSIGSIVLKTSNGGGTWQADTMDKKVLNTVCFINADTGFVGGLGNLYKTENGGDSWSPISLDGSYNIKELKFVNDSIGYLSALYGKMLKSTDCGESWSPLNTGISSHIYAFDFWDADIGYAGGQGGFIKTIDGGENWELLNNAPSEIYSVTCLDKNFVIAGGQGSYSGGDFGFHFGAVNYSTDGGNNWTFNNYLTEVTSIIYLSFPTSKIGFGVGMGSKVLKLGINGNIEISDEINRNDSHIVYPNPANGKIYFQLQDDLRGFNFLLYDIKGKLVANKLISSKEFDISNLNHGIYLYKIITNENTYNGKIVKR